MAGERKFAHEGLSANMACKGLMSHDVAGAGEVDPSDRVQFGALAEVPMSHYLAHGGAAEMIFVDF